MAPLRQRFLGHLQPGQRILDAGCGSGRDTAAFVKAGYQVVATDGSAEMVRLAADHVGRSVLQMRFDEMEFECEFDGVWCCASLLHVPRDEMASVMARFRRALRPGGVWYLSFKLGHAVRQKAGRLFNDQTEESLRTLLDDLGDVDVLETWRTDDVRPGRTDEQWLNCLARRRA